MKIPRGKYIAKNADPHQHEPEHFIKCGAGFFRIML